MFCTWANRIRTHVNARIPTGASAYKRESWRFKLCAAHKFCTWADWIGTHVNACSSAGISQCPCTQRSQHSNMRCQNELVGSRQCYHMLIAMQRETHGRQGKLQAKVIDSSECMRPPKNCERPPRIQNNGCIRIQARVLTVQIMCCPQVLYMSRLDRNTCQCL